MCSYLIITRPRPNLMCSYLIIMTPRPKHVIPLENIEHQSHHSLIYTVHKNLKLYTTQKWAVVMYSYIDLRNEKIRSWLNIILCSQNMNMLSEQSNKTIRYKSVYHNKLYISLCVRVYVSVCVRVYVYIQARRLQTIDSYRDCFRRKLLQLNRQMA